MVDNLNRLIKTNKPDIFRVIEEGELEKLKAFLSTLNDSDINKIVHTRWLKSGQVITPLILAVSLDIMDMAQYLLDNLKVQVDQTESHAMSDTANINFGPNNTALWYAVKHVNLPLAKMLIDIYKADINIHVPGSCTPFELACYIGNKDICGMLLEKKISRCYSHDAGDDSRCVFMAIANNKPEVLNMLLMKGYNVNQKCSNGSTPLHMAAYHGFVDIVVLLLKFGAYTNVRDSYDLTPLQTAALKGNLKVYTTVYTHVQKMKPLTRLDDITAMELMGASIGVMYSVKENRVNCYKYLSNAMKERFHKDKDIMPKLTLSPQDRYGYKLEHKTIGELQKLRGVQFDGEEEAATYENFPLVRESLIVLERVLGASHPYIAYKLAYVIYNHSTEMHNDITVIFIKRIIEIMKDIFADDRDNMFCVLLYILQVQSKLKVYETDSQSTQLREFVSLVYTCVQLHEHQTHWGAYQDIASNIPADVPAQIIDLALRSLCPIILCLPTTGKMFRHLKTVVCKFLHISDTLLKQGECSTSLQHQLYQRNWPRQDQEVLLIRLTKLFHECGANLSLRDKHGLTPLDWLNCSTISIEIRSKLEQLLINSSAKKSTVSKILKTHNMW